MNRYIVRHPNLRSAGVRLESSTRAGAERLVAEHAPGKSRLALDRERVRILCVPPTR